MTETAPNSLPSLTFSESDRLAFISDLHLSPSRPDITERLDQYLREQATHATCLFILGDLFEYWVGDDANIACGYVDIEKLLADYVAIDGHRLLVMHGNRDFLIGNQFCQRTGGELIPDPVMIQIGSHPLLLAHGDAYCTDDVDHQEFRKLTRQQSWQDEFLSRTVEERIGFANQARSRSEAGKSSKSMAIMDVREQSVVNAMEDAKVNTLIHGHTHRPAVHQHQRQDAHFRRVVLGDWYDQNSSLEITGGAIHYATGGRHYHLPLGEPIISTR